jgi:hypothetical protein
VALAAWLSLVVDDATACEASPEEAEEVISEVAPGVWETVDDKVAEMVSETVVWEASTDWVLIAWKLSLDDPASVEVDPTSVEVVPASSELVVVAAMFCRLVEVKKSTVELAEDAVLTASEVDTLAIDEDVAAARIVEDAEALEGTTSCRSTSWWLRSWNPAYKIHEPDFSPATRKKSIPVLAFVVVALHDKYSSESMLQGPR